MFNKKKSCNIINGISIKSVLISGVTVTAVMNLYTFMAPLMGIKLDIPPMLANAIIIRVDCTFYGRNNISIYLCRCLPDFNRYRKFLKMRCFISFTSMPYSANYSYAGYECS